MAQRYVPVYHPSKPGEPLPDIPKPTSREEQPTGQGESSASPVILVQSKKVLCSCGSGTTLMCSVRGTPTPTVEWIQEGKGVCEGERYRSLCEPPLYYLVMSGTDVGDAGEYRIVARNECGENTLTIHVEVLTPQPPDGKCNKVQ
jgi:hypothetical protein